MMRQSLAQLIERFWCVAIIGMEKNTGKTTVLNHVLNSRSEKVCAITSIGFDGEDIDQVTGTKKPVIFVGCGTLVATASNLLGHCDFTREMLALTGIHTALGEVIILRAKSDGYVRLAGPSITTQMEKLLEMLKNCGAEKVYIDGAAARKSTAAIGASDACILSTGASFSSCIDHIVDQTLYRAKLLRLGATKQVSIRSLFTAKPEENPPGVAFCDSQDLDNERMAVDGIDSPVFSNGTSENDCLFLSDAGEKFDLGSALDDATPVMAANHLSSGALIFKGLFSGRFAGRLLERTRSLKGVRIVAQDGTRFFLNSEQYSEFIHRGATFEVIKPGNLMAITINPTSPEDFMVDGNELKIRLEEKSAVPVYDVVAEPSIGLVAQ